MVLSQRLQAVASYVTAGNRLADIGTDHAFVPIFLVERGTVPHAVAMDVNPGPLERARAHIAEHGLQEQISVRLSDGLDSLESGEADTVVIAGMGGGLTVRILEKRKELSAEVRELILQPQSDIASVRRYLETSGWMIDSERMILEEGKYYTIMKCLPGRMTLTGETARFGPCLMKERDDIWISWLLWRKGILERNLESLQDVDGDRNLIRRRELLSELDETTDMISAGLPSEKKHLLT